MRRVSISFFTGVFLFLISKYIFDNLSPFNQTQINNLIVAKQIKPNDWNELNRQIINLIRNGQILPYLSVNAYIGIFIFLASIFCLFVSIHLVIDKLFFKNFYEKASLTHAVRRGIFVILSLSIALFLKLYGLDNLIVISVPVLFILLEILFIIHFNTIVNKQIASFREFVVRVNENIKKVRK